ncbi:4'-phosphopantetheinyl transferase superfamily protein [Gilvimarinus sp. SDUM040013]|uniref:Enterobactin synthase component D n=1 Tax=Gilvimarinus gilvus TaxID=3058038 RepID=A0ABU4S2Q1_9GAMM|nr:4'-phosphopantetheinyl transferase superfamily protein [Gilvimarinus sp. SDUM040013]MDO3384323.1 4'-phosphopantetheinyl transferase superfamily protein [Gilvimarinus sp. SDUM040013]MDX6851430.1 4'-phosphopantetheinyl transferase superfamily protein [Gilvimarinus sp. SDUM040013]
MTCFIDSEVAFTVFENFPVNIVKCRFALSEYSMALYHEFNIDIPPCVSSAVFKRQAEFLAGRYCARRSLSLAGECSGKVGVASNRQPLWPDGYIGSISHNDSSSVAIASKKQICSYLGVDIEKTLNEETIEEIQSLILDFDEIGVIRHINLSFVVAFSVCFSSKESIFKAFFPKVGKYFDFSMAKLVRIDVDRKTAVFVLDSDFRQQYELPSAVEVLYMFDSSDVITCVAIS